MTFGHDTDYLPSGLNCIKIVKFMSYVSHPAELAARLAGLSTDGARAWERSPQAVELPRTAAGHRLHTQNDLERPGRLRDVTQARHAVNQVGLALDRSRQPGRTIRP